MLMMMDSNTYEKNPHFYGAPVSTGTVIIAAEFDGGVVIGADSRTSSGSFVSGTVSDKLTEITDHIFCCRSGSAADTQAIADVATYHLKLYELEHQCKAPVEVGANVFRDLCYKYRDELSAGILVAGWDPRDGGQVYAIPSGGMIMRKSLSTGGSGSLFVYGYLDKCYKANMTRQECEELVKNAVAMAISRDGSCGGVIRLGTITAKGMERQLFMGADIPKFSPDVC